MLAAVVILPWLVAVAWFLWLCEHSGRESEDERRLREDVEVMRLEFAWSLPSFEEGIHAG